MKLRWKKITLALAIILAGGAARMPFEQRYTASLRAQNLLETPLNLSARDELGQSLFIATLGGFRSAVASVMELRSITPWMRGEWGQVEESYAICTRLQPREEHYWTQRSWMQAYNARDSYLLDSMLTQPNRELYAQQSVENGIRVLREGTLRIPESWRLWEQLASTLCMPWNQKPDYAAAAAAYEKAAASPGVPGIYRRFAVYQLSHIPEREREAWDKLIAFYNNPSDRLPTVEIELLYLFYERRIYERHPDVVLPPDLMRLFIPGAVLGPQDQKHREFLIQGVGRRLKPDGISTRPPQISSPHMTPVR